MVAVQDLARRLLAKSVPGLAAQGRRDALAEDSRP
jgi:hypothetical protein